MSGRDSKSQVRLSDDTAIHLLAEIDRELAFHRLTAEVAADVRQDIVAWLLLAERRPSSLTRAWVKHVVRRFLRPKSLARRACEHQVLEAEEVAPAVSPELDGLIFKDWVASLDGTDRAIALRLLEGDSWTEAFEALRVPQGSRSYWRQRLRQSLRAYVTPRTPK